MKKFIYKYVLKPKSEREQLTTNDKMILLGTSAIVAIIVLMTITHYAVQTYLTFEKYDINDSCRVIGITSDGKNYMCKSFLHDGEFYTIDKNSLHTNIYINRKLYHNDNGTFNEKTFDYKFDYVALTKQKRDEINGK